MVAKRSRSPISRTNSGKVVCRAYVLRCSDGTFVIPLARAVCHVVAVDVDPVMLYGGDVVDRGEPVHIRGLCRNLQMERLSDRCTGLWTSKRPTRQAHNVQPAKLPQPTIVT